MQALSTAGMIAGGLGLFLLAIKMITDGLRMAGGNQLRDILGQWTRSPLRGLGSGILITALVQSSSAVTVATIGFVNAGFLGLSRALGVIYGANIGTTMTGWLVAVIGFNLKIDAFSYGLIGLGMLLRLTGSAARRRAAIGESLVGFGLFFIGIDVLKEAFEGMAAAIPIHTMEGAGLGRMFLFVAVGFALTLFTQSSSAAIALILTAATGGVVSLSGAAAMVIGANIGTTSTAAFAVIGATSSAKRVAAAHVIFNLATGLVAMLILPAILWLVGASGSMLGLEAVPAVTLALFHTAFNLLGVALLWPFTPHLASFLEGKFRTAEEDESRLRYLDKTVAATPALALNALLMELARVGEIVRRAIRPAPSKAAAGRQLLHTDQQIISNILREINNFTTSLQRSALSKEVGEALPKILRISRYLSEAGRLTSALNDMRAMAKDIADKRLAAHLKNLAGDAGRLIDYADPSLEGFSLEQVNANLSHFKEHYAEVKDTLLTAGTEQRVSINELADLLDHLTQVRRLTEQMSKAVSYLSHLTSTLGGQSGEAHQEPPVEEDLNNTAAG